MPSRTPLFPLRPVPCLFAKELNIELGFAMMFGLVASILPAYLVLKMASWFDRKYNLPMREASGASTEQLKQIVEKKDDELPGLLLSSLPIALPVLLISLVSILGFCKKLSPQGFLNSESFEGIFPYLEFLGDSNVAMTLAAGFAILGLVRQMAGKQEKDVAAKLGKTLQDPLVHSRCHPPHYRGGRSIRSHDPDVRGRGVSRCDCRGIRYLLRFAGLGRDRLHPDRSRLGHRIHDHRGRAHGRRQSAMGMPWVTTRHTSFSQSGSARSRFPG